MTDDERWSQIVQDQAKVLWKRLLADASSRSKKIVKMLDEKEPGWRARWAADIDLSKELEKMGAWPQKEDVFAEMSRQTSIPLKHLRKQWELHTIGQELRDDLEPVLRAMGLR